jgi:hypothetical protein
MAMVIVNLLSFATLSNCTRQRKRCLRMFRETRRNLAYIRSKCKQSFEQIIVQEVDEGR